MHAKPSNQYSTASRTATSTSSIQQQTTNTSRKSCQSSPNLSIKAISERAGSSMGCMYRQTGSAEALASCCCSGALIKLPTRTSRLCAKVALLACTSTKKLVLLLQRSKGLIRISTRVIKAIIVWYGTRERMEVQAYSMMNRTDATAKHYVRVVRPPPLWNPHPH